MGSEVVATTEFPIIYSAVMSLYSGTKTRIFVIEYSIKLFIEFGH